MTVEYDEINRGLTKVAVRVLLQDAKKGMSPPGHPPRLPPAEVAKRKGVIRDLEGVRVYRGAESVLANNLNAHDMVTHSGWSYQPTPEYLAAASGAGEAD